MIPMDPRRRLLLLIACCMLGLCLSALFGRSYSARHSSHAGFHRVQVADRIDPAFDLRRPCELEAGELAALAGAQCSLDI